MGCQSWHDALSARVDGESLGMDAALLDAHVAGCAGCRAYEAGLSRLHRMVRVAPADVVPDRTEEIMAAATGRRLPTFGLVLVLRWVLVLIAATEMGMSTPEFLSRWHTGGELGTWGIATAIGFLSVAARPQRAAGMFPMLACAALLTTYVSTRDVADGATFMSREWPHGLLLSGVAVLALIWRWTPETADPGPRRAGELDATGAVRTGGRGRFRRAA
jgi:predicted anti-sigma-YlaC factor YlaD